MSSIAEYVIINKYGLYFLTQVAYICITLMDNDTRWLLKEKYNGIPSQAFYNDCERIACGEPIGYIIGHIPFLDCHIFLDSRPLIPRPETEYWTEQAIKEIRTFLYKTKRSSINALDLCAGSGAIGVAIAKAFPESTITFAELDPIHLPTIRKNLEFNLRTNNPIDWTTYQIVKSNLFEKTPGTFDFIFTNPPYIDKAAGTVEDGVVNYEPHVALFGGTEGMEVIEKIIKDARMKLAPPSPFHPGGQIWIEHEPAQVNAIHQLSQCYNFSIITHDDQYGNARFSILTMQ